MKFNHDQTMEHRRQQATPDNPGWSYTKGEPTLTDLYNNRPTGNLLQISCLKLPNAVCGGNELSCGRFNFGYVLRFQVLLQLYMSKCLPIPTEIVLWISIIPLSPT